MNITTDPGAGETTADAARAARRAGRAIREGRQATLKGLRQIGEPPAHLAQHGLSEAATRGRREYQSDRSIQVVGARDTETGKARAAGYDDGSPAVRRAWDLLGEVTARRSAQAEKRFRAEPTTADLRAWSDAAARAMTFGDGAAPGALPPGVERRDEERRYVIRAGDTLSAISKRFYGSAACRDVV